MVCWCKQRFGLDLVWVPIAPFYYWPMLEVTFYTICHHIPFHQCSEQLASDEPFYLADVLPILMQSGGEIITDEEIGCENYSD